MIIPIVAVVSAIAVVSDFSQLAQVVSPMTSEEAQLRRDAYTRVSLITHSWKMAYFSLHPKGVNVGADYSGSATDIWDVLSQSELPTYNRENWIRYYPLFNEHLESMRRDLQEALVAYADILPPEIRSRIERTRTQLIADKTVYYWMPRGGMGEHTPKMFQSVFVEVPQTLKALDAEAQSRRNEL